MLRIQHAALTAVLVTVLVAPALAQNVTQVEIQRLQDNIFQASTDVSQLRSRDAARATQLQTELDELREEVIYLKVKLRKERSLARTEYADVRDRIEDLRTSAREDRFNTYAAPAPAPTQPAPRTTATTGTGTTTRGALEIPSGTEIDVRLSNNLNSGTALVEDRF